MRIAVCVKEVPDPWLVPTLRAGDATVDRATLVGVLSEIDECAVEEALRIAEAHGGDVTVVTMGPGSARDAVRKALSMGVGAGIHLVDDAAHGSDALATSHALAELLSGRGFDLVVFGSASTDAGMGIIPAMVAERLGVAQLTLARRVEVRGTRVTIERVTESGHDVVVAEIPAVISVVVGVNEPRYPSFAGITGSRRRPVETLTVGTAGLDAAHLGMAAARSVVVDFAPRPLKLSGSVVTDAGDGGARIAEFLIREQFV